MVIFWSIIVAMTLIAVGFLLIPLLRVVPDMPTKQVWQNYLTALILLIALPVISFTLYLNLGASQTISERQQNNQLIAEIKKLGSLQNIILALKQKVLAKPDSEGWFLLGRLYFKNQQLKEARAALLEANRLKPNQPKVINLLEVIAKTQEKAKLE